MCMICQRSPCDSRCPNAPDPVPILNCRECGEGIFQEDEYLETLSGPICKNCLEDMTVEEMLKIFGERLSVAQGGY